MSALHRISASSTPPVDFDLQYPTSFKGGANTENLESIPPFNPSLRPGDAVSAEAVNNSVAGEIHIPAMPRRAQTGGAVTTGGSSHKKLLSTSKSAYGKSSLGNIHVEESSEAKVQ